MIPSGQRLAKLKMAMLMHVDVDLPMNSMVIIFHRFLYVYQAGYPQINQLSVAMGRPWHWFSSPLWGQVSATTILISFEHRATGSCANDEMFGKTPGGQKMLPLLVATVQMIWSLEDPKGSSSSDQPALVWEI